MSDIRIDLSVVLYREDHHWIAHCLEMDIAAEGANQDEAIECLESLCSLQIETAYADGDISAVFQPAPRELWRLFAISADRKQLAKGKSLPKVNRFAVRELIPA